jgi:predicted enzyme related to lactoylglutathione lyase
MRIRIARTGAAALLLAAVAQAGAASPAASLTAARVGGMDVPALAKFYEDAFGLKETRRLEFPGNMEIFLNFGDSVDAAKASTSPQILVMHRADDLKDPVPHLLFDVTDMAATAAAVKAAGGKLDGEPRPFGTSGMMIGVAIDPAGNRIELIQRPKPAKP